MREEKTLETLTQLLGVGGFEREVREWIEKEAAPYADEIETGRHGKSDRAQKRDAGSVGKEADCLSPIWTRSDLW